MFKRTEVLTLVAHLIITLALLILYGVTLIMDRPDTTLQNALLLALGFWFGSIGGSKIKEALTGKRKDDNSL